MHHAIVIVLAISFLNCLFSVVRTKTWFYQRSCLELSITSLPASVGCDSITLVFLTFYFHLIVCFHHSEIYKKLYICYCSLWTHCVNAFWLNLTHGWCRGDSVLEFHWLEMILTFCSDILFFMVSTEPGQGMDSLQFTLPKGIWLSFDFGDSHPVCITVHIDMF